MESVRERAGKYKSVWERAGKCGSVHERVGACGTGSIMRERMRACGGVRERLSVRERATQCGSAQECVQARRGAPRIFDTEPSAPVDSVRGPNGASASS